MPTVPLQKIVICGAGLAGLMCAAALSKSLPSSIEIVLIDSDGAGKTDVFFGTTTTPSSYKFLLDLGLREPDLLPITNTSFSLGTQYINWGSKARSWMQSFHQPLPIFEGVEFHHFLTRIRSVAPSLAELEPYLMSVQAARKSVFAHPRQDQITPLSNVEYGYHFLPLEWRKILANAITLTQVEIVKTTIEAVSRQENDICHLVLSDNTRIDADLFIDCMGHDSIFSMAEKKTINRSRQLNAATSFKPQETLGGVSRTLAGKDFGWTSKTPLQDGVHTLTMCHPSSEQDALKNHDTRPSKPVTAVSGFCNQPWRNNYLALGHSAAILEPLTPAPIALLQRDIQRLIELIPVTPNMSVERREYNRRFKEDYEHAAAFQRGFFEPHEKLDTPYWMAVNSEPLSAQLENKITQFQSRGALVQDDMEPFGKEDWTQLHLGMGRTPQRYNKIADKVPENVLRQTLQNRISANAAMTRRLPSHHDYMTKLLEYFRKQA